MAKLKPAAPKPQAKKSSLSPAAAKRIIARANALCAK
jgi:hypothetical protein